MAENRTSRDSAYGSMGASPSIQAAFDADAPVFNDDVSKIYYILCK